MARWSPLIGASHSKDYIVWEYGGMASPGVTKVSEWGAVDTLEREMKNQRDNVFRLGLRQLSLGMGCKLMGTLEWSIFA